MTDNAPSDLGPVIPLGTKVKPWGKVAAIMRTGGERYYMFEDARGMVSMIPASVVAAHLAEVGDAG